MPDNKVSHIFTMPILRALKFPVITDDEFAEIDAVVMRCAYSVQNKFGRFFDERIYENDLAARLRAEGLEVHTQVPITVSHGSFAKPYFLDLVLGGMPYELKVESAIVAEHEAQCFHYAMLQNVRLVKLLNFGEPKVRGKLLRNALTEADRHRATMRSSGWRILTPQCQRLIDQLKVLVKDWGTHLSSQLYNEALVHFFGGITHCLSRLEVNSGTLKLGTHLVQLHAPDHAFAVTSFTQDQTAYHQHLKTLLDHIDLKAIQWINLNHSRVEITTIEKC